MSMRVCEVCEQSYSTMFPDIGTCRLCEIRERPWRQRIAKEVAALGGSTFIVESIKRGAPPRFRPGGMSDLTIPEYDPEPDGWHVQEPVQDSN